MMENKILEQVYSWVEASGGVGIDSRKIKPNDIFFALAGEQVDGNDYVVQAIQQGAFAVVCSRWDQAIAFDNVVVVADPLKMLQELARRFIAQFKGPILGITGSNGKTTNKELIATVLSAKYKVHKTLGNFNNHIGLPLTVLNTPKETEFLVLEMGTNHFGEIEFLCNIGQPLYGIILNVGKSHLEFLESVAGVLKAKTEMADYLAENDGLLFINEDETSILPLINHSVSKYVYGLNKEVGSHSVKVIEKTPYIKMALEDIDSGDTFEIATQLIGEHQIRNLVNAVHIALYFGIETAFIQSSLESFLPGNNRSKLIEWRGNQVYLDAYNANPTSMWASLKGFDEAFSGEKIFILGEMGELGAMADTEHLSLIHKMESFDSKCVIFIGERYLKHKKLANKDFFFYSNIDDYIVNLQKNGYYDSKKVFVKGSRVLRLEKLLNS